MGGEAGSGQPTVARPPGYPFGKAPVEVGPVEGSEERKGREMNAKFRRVVGSAIVTAVVLGTLPVPAPAAQGGRQSRVDHSAPAPDKSSPVLTSKPPSAPRLRPAGSSAFSPAQ